jgi:hypothetical protein
MFTSKNNNVITRCYIELYQSGLSSDQWIDIFKLFNDNVYFIFVDKSLLYEDINNIIQYLNIYHINYVFLHYDDFTKLYDIHDIIYNININVDGNLALNYRRNDLYSRNVYYDLCNPNINCVNLACDLYVDKDNIYNIHSTICMLSDINIPCNIYFKDHKKSSCYGDHMCHSIQCMTRDITNRLILDNILKDKLLINNRDKIESYYYTVNEYCNIDTNIDKLYINNRGNVTLCPNIKIDLGISVFECINNNTVTDMFKENIQKAYQKYCMGCNYKQV